MGVTKILNMKKTTKLLFIIAAIVLLNIIYYLGQWGGDTVLQYVSDILPIICSFIALVGLYTAVKSFKEMDFTRVAWLLIFIGIFFDFLAETTYAILEIVFKVDINIVFPTIADLFWCVGYIPMFIGLVMMFWGYRKSGFPMGRRSVYWVVILSFLVFSTILGYYLLIPIANDSETSLLAKFFYFYYPLADLIIVVPAVILMYITSLFGRSIISMPWRMMALGFLLFTIADMLYAYLGWNDMYGNGNLIDVLWHSGYLFIGLSGLYQKQLLESIN